MGGLPSIRFVPESVASLEDVDEDGKCVEISVTDYIQKYLNAFKEGGREAVIQLICRHKSIVADSKLQ